MYTLALVQSGTVQDGEGPHVVRAIREALATIAPADVHDLVLALALRKAGLADVPERGPALKAFVVGALYFAVRSAVTSVAAETTTRELLRVLATQMAPRVELDERPSTSGVRARAHVSANDDDTEVRPTLPVRMTHREVVLVTRDRLLVQHVARLLGSAHLHVVPDAGAVKKALASVHSEAPLVLVDCMPPGVSVSTIAELERPNGSVIVAWGARADLDAELVDPRTAGWSRCHSDEGPEALDLLLGGLCDSARLRSSLR